MELKFSIEQKPYINDLIRNLNKMPKINLNYLLGMSKFGYVNYV